VKFFPLKIDHIGCLNNRQFYADFKNSNSPLWQNGPPPKKNNFVLLSGSVDSYPATAVKFQLVNHGRPVLSCPLPAVMSWLPSPGFPLLVAKQWSELKETASRVFFYLKIFPLRLQFKIWRNVYIYILFLLKYIKYICVSNKGQLHD
jgi:hypothetical protein